MEIELSNDASWGFGTRSVSQILVTEDLGDLAGVLGYETGSSEISINGGGYTAIGDPSGSTLLQWNLSGLTLGRNDYVRIRFQLQHEPNTEEQLVDMNPRNLHARAEYVYDRDNNNYCDTQNNHTLPIVEPRPSFTKGGRNVDAGMGAGTYAAQIYGHQGDGIIWRVALHNGGSAPLQDVVITDDMTSGAMDIDAICSSESDAAAVANGASASFGSCTDVSGYNNNLAGLDASDLGFSLNVAAGGDLNLYFAGQLHNACDNLQTNTFHDLQWGCPAVGGTGGITHAGGDNPVQSSPADASAAVSVHSQDSGGNNGGVNYNVTFNGIDGGNTVGTRGLVTITVTNNSQGTIKGVRLTDSLPAGYLLDPNYEPQMNRSYTYGNYDGRVSTFDWENRVIPTAGDQSYLEDSANPGSPNPDLQQPVFFLTSSGDRANNDPDQMDLLRQGEQVSLTFRIVLVEPGLTHYDQQTDLDMEGSADPDPAAFSALQNNVQIDWQDFCASDGGDSHSKNNDWSFTPRPEDLDVSMTHPLYIVRDSGDSPLTVQIDNNGGHAADDYYIYVTFGEEMTVLGEYNPSDPDNNPYQNPISCTEVAHSPELERPVWEQPSYIPDTATVYRCSRDQLGAIAAGGREYITFQVEKNATAADDDLTFRADVIGEITLATSDREPLVFPDPASLTDSRPDKQQADNYSLDATRARVMGFNLLKEPVANSCAEYVAGNRPGPENNIEIGEDCTFDIHAGGWFGFKTPGYNLIAVRDVTIADDLPDGQSYIAHNYLTSSPAHNIDGSITESGLSADFSEADLSWFFAATGGGSEITEKDHWFHADMTTRLLNGPVDTVADPNQHANVSTDYGRGHFTAVFDTETIDVDETQNIPGYPPESDWRVDMNVTEPQIEVDKKVCNEALYGTGTGCSKFVDFTDEGHRDQNYIFQLTLTNRATDGGVARAPAYDVVVTDTLDSSGQMCVQPLDSDGLDNDGDTGVDTGVGDEGLVGTTAGSNDYNLATDCADGGTPAVITFSYAHSTALQRIDPGKSVTLYYRVKPEQSVAPLQTFTNRFYARYDSLLGDYGNQQAPQIDSDTDDDGIGCGTADTDEPSCTPNYPKGRARHYQSAEAEAQMQIISVQAEPKKVIALSNGTPTGTASDEAVIGEELRYRLTAQIPAAQLRDFVIRDELPVGMQCVEGQTINLDAAPFNAAGFSPGGSFTPTCGNNGTRDYIEWDFGNQELTTVSGSLFEFPVEFIARIENSASTNDSDVLINGGSSTTAEVHYVNESGTTVVVPFESHQVTVREPDIQLSKSFAVSDSDADDILTVTVAAKNTGSANAYNLQVLDDLTGSKLVYLGNVAGTDPPQNVDTGTVGSNAPIFSWDRGNADYSIAPGESKTFTFDVRVEQGVEPREVLDNTVQARWQSLPGTDTALNSSGGIGSDGDTDGMRIGVLPNTGDALNDYETSAAAQTEVPPLQISKTDLDSTLAPTIGAHKQFQLEIRLPEGVSNHVVVTDQLGSPEGYVLANNADYDIAYEFVGIETINGQAPSAAAFHSVPVDNTAGSASWDIGTVDTASENDTAGSALDPLIRITYYARVANDALTDAGDSRQNGAVLTYDNGESGATESESDNTAAVTVVEPLLTIDKAVSNTTNPGTEPVGGDILQYTITVQHDAGSSAAAFDLNLVDTLPGELQLDSSFTPTATIGGTAVAGFVATPAGAPAGPLVWGRDNGDNSLDLPQGQTLVLTYRARVTGVFGQSINNSAVLGWTSLNDNSPNAAAYERDDSDCVNGVPSGFNDYCAGPAEVSIGTVDNTSISKSVIADSDDATPLGTLRVGDTATFRLELQLQSGTTPAVTVTDQLPAGLTFDSIVSINGDTSAPYGGSDANGFTYSANSVPNNGASGTVSWDLGDITSEFGNGNTFVIEYRARVSEDTGLAAPSVTLTNTAQLNYTGAATVREDDASITVLQPLIDGLQKTDATWPNSHMDVDPANDVMHFTLHACNSGLAPAYQLALTDDLAWQMDETSIANVAVSVDGNPLAAGSDYSYTAPGARGGAMEFAISAPIPAAACFDIRYNIGFHTDIGGGETWQNSFSVDHYWSLPAEQGQKYAAVDLPTPYPMGTVATSVTPPQKTLQSAATAAVGDEVRYRIQVPGTATTAQIYDVAVEDALDPSLQLVAVREINGRAFTNNSSGNNLSLAVDKIPAGQTAIFSVTARVANNSDAQAGHSFDNTASYTYAASDGGTQENGGSGSAPTLTVVEPDLSLNGSIANLTSPGSAPDAGDRLRFTLALAAAGGAQNSDAFDLTAIEQLSAGLQFVAGSGTFAGSALVDPAIAGAADTGQTLRWDRGNSNLDIAAGSSAPLIFDVVVTDRVLADAELSGSSHIEWTSLDEDNSSPYERNGSATPALNDYVIDGSVAGLTAANDSTLAKTRLDDSYGSGDAQVRVGDFVDYELRLDLQEGSLPNAALVDTLPQGMVFERTLSINGDSSAPFAAGGAFAYDDVAEPVASGDPAAGPTTLTWTLANLVNPGDNDAGNDTFVIRYRARVLNGDVHPWPANSVALANSADFGFDGAGGRENRNDGETVDLRQPNLALALSATPASGSTLSPGDTIDYTVTLTNDGSAPAYDTVFRDTIPAGLREGGVSVQSLTVNGAPVATPAPTFDTASGAARWNFGSGTAYAIDPGQSLVMTYRVRADSDLGAGLNLQNAARIAVYYSLDDDALATLGDAAATADMREDYGPAAPQSVQFNTPNAAPLEIENTQGSASIGEPFRYRVTIPATPQTTALHDVQLKMNLGSSAADLVFVDAARVSGAAFTPVNSGSDTDLVIEDTASGIDVPPGEQVVLDVTLRLRDSNPPNVDGLTFSNSASYSYNYLDDDTAAGQGAGAGNTTADMAVVEPTALILDKRGPASVQSGVPGRFTLDVLNTGSGPAWDIALTDILPNPDPGGMCATAPENFAAQIADGAGNSIATLNEGSDFNVVFDADSCTLTITTSGADAALPADQRLLFSYDAYLDADTVDGATLTNIAGAGRWYSWDSTGADAREYSRAAPTDGTPTVDDHEDAYTISASVPKVSFRKVVENVTRGERPASVASPGDRLRYTLTLTNLSSVDVTGIDLTDELGRLNSLPLFAPGSLQVVSIPAGADSGNTDSAGGAGNSGLLDVRALDLRAGSSVEIVYEVNLATVIDSGTAVLNQAQVQLPGQLLQDSDDPNINGADDPDSAGDEDPTRVRIESAPELVVEKTSADLSGDADLLMVGDTLRYTLKVENTGDENIVDALLRDQVPANTTYVANSTTLNGAAVADVGGSTALSAGLAIHSDGQAQGFVGATAGGAEPLLVTFDVTVNDVNDGTVISNQGFVNGAGAGSGALDEQPSDDPATGIADDPTIDIVGDVPALIAHKTVAIAEDGLSAGIVDPGDVLRYTMTVRNMGGVDATAAMLTDQVPANTSYVGGSTRLNGVAVPDVGGTSPLAAGLSISSDDLAPPLPGAGDGVISSARSATITFDVRVNAGTATGTVISNQGSVATAELPLALTDADGNPSNGAQPTEIVVGDAQALSITKEVAVVGGGAAEPGATLEYLVQVTNISAVAATDVGISDDLLVAGDGVLTFLAGSAQLNGQADGISVDGSRIRADVAGTSGALQPGDVATLRFRARLGSELQAGDRVLNTALVSWNDPAVTAEASVAIDVGGTPGIANLGGYLWHDVNFNGERDGDERLLQNWAVALYFNGELQETLQSDENGYFRFDGLVPNGTSSGSAGASYELRYSAPDAGDTTASLGNAQSDFTNGPQKITRIYVGSGSNPQGLNLPLTPNGVVYDSVQRQPVAGAIVTMLSARTGQALPERCFDDDKQQNQVTRAGGYYKFDLNFSDAACPPNRDYLLQVRMPGEDFVAGESQIIPPQTNADTAGFDVAACLGSPADQVPATAEHCEVQASEQAPALDVDARDAGTNYYLRVRLDDNRIPGESQLFNNHIPVDPQLGGALSITKTAALLNVTRSQLVPYTITFSNTLGVPLSDLRLVDFFPAGFKYVAGSARVDGRAIEPQVDGLQLVWPDLRVQPDQTRTVKLLLVVGSGVGEGKYVNRARMFNQLSGQQASGEASATVRVIPDPTFDCTDVIGKVYDDKNLNGYQDAGEGGVAGARLVTATGLHATTDAHGRYHITCAVVPNRDRGSNFVLKLDDRSLPSGYRLTSENPRVVRATRGKMIKVNFGSSLHRVVRLDLAEAVFEPGTTELRPQWHSRTELLLKKLSEAPSVLRLSYLAENEAPDLVDRRLQVMKAKLAEEWAHNYGDYELTIETEVYWRRGAPPSEDDMK
ncbi:isopeptide-forming domain-containing fimbrial protein [Microbulbifer sp. SAOS-129_SWC]|uniref:isopeptide-forming domain-containing fimbrial protein n=1 Tax=Microbulbifer sp. SAOS-129_SWC TaxID=3145235 RepID=UPI0032166D65